MIFEVSYIILKLPDWTWYQLWYEDVQTKNGFSKSKLLIEIQDVMHISPEAGRKWLHDHHGGPVCQGLCFRKNKPVTSSNRKQIEARAKKSQEICWDLDTFQVLTIIVIYMLKNNKKTVMNLCCS
ncbi:uncharacterized protein LOC129003331 [Macrosteles quadrilineatus]|uniref:uncharacterized protein LOC129003331 n=1 Tax=Macrosteles quadrilineatus TaxID=74068 RepID=UPI0023E0FD98|nr:uncharacterized protein LOC129003331 [Macrosteles quadrilineatus]